MSTLTVQDFRTFFRELHGHDPYPWQERLVRQVLERSWPGAVELPTGTGKTAVLDVAVFALAAQAGLPPARRATGIRIFYVVDRRIVVDAAEERALAIARRLQEHLAVGAQNVLARVARALLRFGGRWPLRVVKLRGAMYRQQRWIDAPNQPTVCLTTVDQIGSRLLFRGYGVSPYQWPLHAGLAGCDALYLLDEAHMSWPFLETLLAVGDYPRARVEIAPPPQVVALSATLPPATPGDVFRLLPEDLEHEDLARRVGARKPARLEEVPSPDFEETMARFARELAAQPEVRSVGVIVNRVSSARRIAGLLLQDPAWQDEVLLLTGRVRPFDRDRLLERLHRGGLPRFVVATQAIEVGADLDFDALVTELAPLDALRQRFGRLNRSGRREEAPAVVVRRRDRDAAPYEADELERCWRWLTQRGSRQKGRRVVDFGSRAMDELLVEGDAPRPAPRRAPVLLPAVVDRWAQTHPAPDPDPDVAPFLHGLGADPSADVQVVWRADIAERDLDEGRARFLEDLLALVPPRLHEMLPVPVWAVRRWLSRGPGSGDVADVEGAPGGAGDAPAGARQRKAFRWQGPGESEIVSSAQIRPGDTLVVPASYGGVDRFGWNPEQAEPDEDSPPDVYELGLWNSPSAGDFLLRLHPAVVDAMLRRDAQEREPELHERLRELIRALEELDRRAAALQLGAFLDELAARVRPEWVPILQRARDASRTAGWLLYPQRTEEDAPSGLLVRVAAPGAQAPASAEAQVQDLVSDEREEDSLRGTKPVSLRDHSERVERYAAAFAAGCGLPAPLVTCLSCSARFHDLGKAEPRMQVLLHSGDVVAAAAAEEPLAKSGLEVWDRATRRMAYELARYPSGLRHEFVSAGLLARNLDALDGVPDPDLVLYLVGAHHGRGRPFVLPVDDPEPQVVDVELGGYRFRGSSAHGLDSLASGWADRFWSLVRRYGPWGLAYLEAVLRLADHRASEEEAQP